MCGGLRPFARAVGGCAGAVRWERLPLVLEAIRRAGAAGWRCGGRSGNWFFEQLHESTTVDRPQAAGVRGYAP